MMAWYIASIPFWLIGALLLFAVPASLHKLRHQETTNSEAKAYFAILILSGVSFYIAARMVS